MIERLAERELETRFGIFNEILYRDGDVDSIALVMGNVASESDVLCRIHSACLGGHVFSSVECECAAEMAAAQAAIRDIGRGIVIYLDQEGKGNGHLALMRSIPFKKMGYSQSEAYRIAGYPPDARSYLPATEILKDLSVASVILLSEDDRKADQLAALGVAVARTEPLNL